MVPTLARFACCSPMLILISTERVVKRSASSASRRDPGSGDKPNFLLADNAETITFGSNLNGCLPQGLPCCYIPAQRRADWGEPIRFRILSIFLGFTTAFTIGRGEYPEHSFSHAANSRRVMMASTVCAGPRDQPVRSQFLNSSSRSTS